MAAWMMTIGLRREKMIFSRWYFRRFLLTGMLLMGLLNGCSTMFDAPSTEGLKKQVSARVMNDLATIAAEEAMELMPETISMGSVSEKAVATPKATAGNVNALVSTPVHTVGDMTSKRAAPLSDDMLLLDSSASPRTRMNGSGATNPRAPSLSFDKIDSDMPQLLIQAMRGATVSLDGEKIEMKDGKDLQVVLIHPGRHGLKVDYSSGAPFTADFYIEKGERLTLRGN